jgi:PDZ domain-containing protein
LALTLSVIEVITEGELTGGLQVATTGTIELDGAVGPIGGIAQKAHAVRRSGVDVFIVPASQADEILSIADDAYTVIGVETLDDAIEALGRLGGDTEQLALSGPELQPAA